MSYLREQKDGVLIQIHAQPGARKNQIVGVSPAADEGVRSSESLKIKIAAPPEDGKANAALCTYLAKILGVAKGSVSIQFGSSSRNKSVLVTDVTAAEVRMALQGAGTSIR